MQTNNIKNNTGTIHIEQHQHIYTYQNNEELNYENDIQEEDAKRNIEQIKHLEFINNLPNEKRIASLENAHKKWDTGLPFKMREGNSEFIDFLEKTWLQLAEFYTSKNFDNKSPKQYISDYIDNRSTYHHSKHTIGGQFLGGSDTRTMIGGDIINDLDELIKDMVFTFSIYNDDFNYDKWISEWNIEDDENGNMI